MNEINTFIVNTNPNLVDALFIVWSVEAMAALLVFIKNRGRFSYADVVSFVIVHMADILMIVLAAVIDMDIITVGSIMTTSTILICICISSLKALDHIGLIGGDTNLSVQLRQFFNDMIAKLTDNQPIRSSMATAHVPAGLEVYSAPDGASVIPGVILSEGEQYIVAVSAGPGSEKGYGLLQSISGAWINLDHCIC